MTRRRELAAGRHGKVGRYVAGTAASAAGCLCGGQSRPPQSYHLPSAIFVTLVRLIGIILVSPVTTWRAGSSAARAGSMNDAAIAG